MASMDIKLSSGDVVEPTQVIIAKGFHKNTRDANSPAFTFPVNTEIYVLDVSSKDKTRNI